MTASSYYPDTALYTDDWGKWLLIDRLGLKFKEVCVDLNERTDSDIGWWALGKLHAYRAQTEPFVHIDDDLYLWKRLPKSLETAPVFAQNPEHTDYCYHPEVLERVLNWLPDEWHWYRRLNYKEAACCGILGGQDVAFIQHADQAIKIIEHPDNQAGMATIPNKPCYMVLLEQYLLSACAKYHKRPVSTLFGHHVTPEAAQQYGFTHLLAGSKRNHTNISHLEAKMRRIYPDIYRLCTEVADELDSMMVKNVHMDQS